MLFVFARPSVPCFTRDGISSVRLNQCFNHVPDFNLENAHGYAELDVFCSVCSFNSHLPAFTGLANQPKL